MTKKFEKAIWKRLERDLRLPWGVRPDKWRVVSATQYLGADGTEVTITLRRVP